MRANPITLQLLSEEEQERANKSCLRKFRFEKISDIAKAILEVHKREGRVLFYYDCKVCGGLHLTSNTTRAQKKKVKKMIKNHNKKIK